MERVKGDRRLAPIALAVLMLVLVSCTNRNETTRSVLQAEATATTLVEVANHTLPAQSRPTQTPTKRATATPRRPAGKATPAAKKPTQPVPIPAPRPVGYDGNVFSWQWNGQPQVGKQDWYFDIQFYKTNAQDPYHVIVANPKQVTLANGTWFFASQVGPQCEAYWVVQIAVRRNGAFAGWISPKSDRKEIGGGCRDNQPPPTECVGCG